MKEGVNVFGWDFKLSFNPTVLLIGISYQQEEWVYPKTKGTLIAFHIPFVCLLVSKWEHEPI